MYSFNCSIAVILTFLNTWNLVSLFPLKTCTSQMLKDTFQFQECPYYSPGFLSTILPSGLGLKADSVSNAFHPTVHCFNSLLCTKFLRWKVDRLFSQLSSVYIF